MMRFACPSCKTVLQAPAERAGAQVVCPSCQNRLQVPGTPPSAAPVAVAVPVVPVAAPVAPVAAPVAMPVQPAVPVAAPLANAIVTPAAAPTVHAMAAVVDTEMDFAVLGNGAPAPSAPSRRRQPKPSFIKRALSEFGAVGAATLAHSTRQMGVLHQSWGGRSLRQASWTSRLVFGQRLYDQQIGGQALRQQIHDLGEQIHRVTTAQGKPGLMIQQRQEALLQLADSCLALPEPPPGLDREYHQANAAHARFLKYQHRLDGERAGLPTGPGTRRRLFLGYAFLGVLTLAMIGLFGYGVSLLGSRPNDRNKPPPPVAEAPKPKRPDLPRTEVVRQSGKSVALIKGKRGFGTGFVVKPNVIATNAHVIDFSPINQLEVFFPSAGEEGKQPRKVQALLYEDKKRDLAFLSVYNPFAPLEIADEYEFLSGLNITIIGNPGAGNAPLENAVSGGTLSTKHQIEGQDYFQMDIGANPGNSGGPVFDATGLVIGVVTLKQRDTDRIAYCVPWGDLTAGMYKAIGQSKDEVAAATALHDLSANFVRVAIASRECEDAVGDIAYRAQEATRNRKDPVAAVRSVFEVHQENLKRMDKELLEGVTFAMNSVGTDHRIPEQIRAEMVEFWATYQALRKVLNEKIDSKTALALFESRSQEQMEKLGMQIRKLAIKLGFNDRRLGL